MLRRRRFTWVALAALVFSGPAGAALPRSDHCDGRHFHNPEREAPGRMDHLRWFLDLRTVTWPAWVTGTVQPPPPARIEGGRLRITCVNQATVLIQTEGLNLLTDPIWSARASPVSWVGPRRVQAPGVAFENLPRIDVVLLSHDHYDHLDLPTLRRLCQRDRPTIVTGLGNGRRLAGLNAAAVVELDWWQEWPISDTLAVRFVPARHQSGRGLFDHDETLWGGFALEGSRGTVLFAGDTGFGRFFGDIARRCSPIRVALLPLGNSEPRFMMRSMHMNAADAVQARALLGAPPCLGIHVATFREHPAETIDAPWRDLAAALQSAGVSPEQFRIPAFGEGIELGAGQLPALSSPASDYTRDGSGDQR
jgi:L-ascorbate metabolism protein UlaG (beta-lactamase superfamily)